MITAIPSRTWAEVNLDNIAHNYHEFCRISGTRVMCVIKADAYGHGAVALAKRLQKEGCDAFGVATVDEGIELRRAGITQFILLLNQVPPSRIDCALKNDLTMTVYSCERASLINEKAERKTKIHLKFDTGMTRVGVSVDQAEEVLRYVSALENIEIEGVFTHFSSADEVDPTYTLTQIARLESVFTAADNLHLKIKIKHAANSAATIMYPKTHLDMVRVGISLYGCYPSEEVDKTRVDLRPAMQLKTQIFRINQVNAGTPVSYGRLFTAQRPTRLATLPVGYADGLSRVMVQKLKVLVGGQLAPVVGKICMDQCIVDITDITTIVKEMDEVVIYGWQDGAFLPVERVADCMGTINYEVLCMTSRRVPRYYYEDGEITNVENFLLHREPCDE